jgi:hypothetical protein
VPRSVHCLLPRLSTALQSTKYLGLIRAQLRPHHRDHQPLGQPDRDHFHSQPFHRFHHTAGAHLAPCVGAKPKPRRDDGPERTPHHATRAIPPRSPILLLQPQRLCTQSRCDTRNKRA